MKVENDMYSRIEKYEEGVSRILLIQEEKDKYHRMNRIDMYGDVVIACKDDHIISMFHLSDYRGGDQLFIECELGAWAVNLNRDVRGNIINDVCFFSGYLGRDYIVETSEVDPDNLSMLKYTIRVYSKKLERMSADERMFFESRDTSQYIYQCIDDYNDSISFVELKQYEGQSRGKIIEELDVFCTDICEEYGGHHSELYFEIGRLPHRGEVNAVVDNEVERLMVGRMIIDTGEVINEGYHRWMDTVSYLSSCKVR